MLMVVPEHILDYRLQEEIGKGTFSTVYRAEKNGVECALKLMRVPEGLSKDNVLDMMRYEFWVMKDLRHPAIIALHDFGSLNDGRVFLVTELIRGINLREFCRTRSFVACEPVFIAVMQGLATLHHWGICHSDIKSPNIIVDEKTLMAKLLDFGLAKITLQTPKSQTISGTPSTIAPEVVLGEPATTKSDLYSLGATLYEVLAGFNPFVVPGDTKATLKTHLNLVPDPIGLIRADVPPKWNQLITALLHKNPLERPESIDAALAAVTNDHKGLIVAAKLTGRDDELKLVDTIATALDHHQKLAVVVDGEAGIGVKRLLTEILYMLVRRKPEWRARISLDFLGDTPDRDIVLSARGVAPQAYPTHTVTLEPLTSDQTCAWLTSTLGVQDIPEIFLDTLYRLTRGIPRLISEALKNLNLAGELTDAEGHISKATLALVDWQKLSLTTEQGLSDDFNFVLTLTKNLVGERKIKSNDALFDKLTGLANATLDSVQKLNRRAQTLLLCAAVEIDTGLFEPAREKLLTALEIFSNDTQAIVDQIRARNYLAYIHLRQGDKLKAIMLYEQSAAERRECLSSAEQQVITNLDLGLAYLEARRYAQAIQTITHELATKAHLTPPKKLAHLYNLALAHAGLKNHDEACRYYKEVIGLARETSQPPFLLRGFNGLANSLSQTNNQPEALFYYSEALELALALKDFRAAATALLNRGLTQKKLSNKKASQEDCERVLKYLGKIARCYAYENRLKVMAQTALAELKCEDGDTNAARGLLDEAWHLVEHDEQLSSERFNVLAARCLLWRDTNQETLLKQDAASLHFYAGDDAERKKIYLDVTTPQKTVIAPKNVPKKNSVPILNGSPRADATSLDRLIEITGDLIGDMPLDTLMNKILTHAVALTQAELGIILTADELGALAPRVSLNIDLDKDLSEISLSIADKVLATGKPVKTDNAVGDTELSQYASVMSLSLKSILGVPIAFKGKILGVLYLSHRYRLGLFDAENVAVAVAFAQQAGMALKNHELLTFYRRNNENLKEELDNTRVDLARVNEELKTHSDHTLIRLGKHELITRSAKMRELLHQTSRIAKSTVTVMIQGESGSGKELLAHYIHHESSHHKGPFIAVNCGVLPQNLVESELFGHKKGAFTGADQDKVGLIEAANSGTLFLDEIVDLPLDTQVKLLRVLQEKEITRLGETRPRPVEVRVIAASHKNVTEAVSKKIFREDLYYRLAAIELTVPPLRERREDIPLIATHFLKALTPANKRPATLSAGLTKMLVDHSWPGNVRELKNVIDVALALAPEKVIKTTHLPHYIVERLTKPTSRPDQTTTDTTAGWYDPRRTWQEHELLIYASSLIALDFNIPRTATSLKVGTATVYKWLRDHRLRELKDQWVKKVLPYKEGTSLDDLRRFVFAQASARHPGHPYHAAKELAVAPVTFYRYAKK